MGGAGTAGKLFGVELKFPDLSIDFPTMGEIKSDINKLLPEWVKDPKAWATRNFEKLEKWAKDLIPELPELGDIIPDISFDFPNPMAMIGDAIAAQMEGRPQQLEMPGFFPPKIAEWKNWIISRLQKRIIRLVSV